MKVYIYQASLLCEPCGMARRADLIHNGLAPENPEDETTYDSGRFPKGPYPEGGGRADSPQHCDSCRRFLRNPLTNDGIKYVVDTTTKWTTELLSDRRDWDPNSPVPMWSEFYELDIHIKFVNGKIHLEVDYPYHTIRESWLG